MKYYKIQNSVKCGLRIISQEIVLVCVHILTEEISCAIYREREA